MYKAILPSLLLLWASSTFSQESLKYFTVKQGLTQNSVTAILRSKDGMLWVGTQDGLNRFDGYSFVHFRHDPDDSLSLSDQYVTAIHEDIQGNIWVGTRHGLNLLNKRNNNFLRIYPDEKSRNKVQSQTQHIANKSGDALMAAIATNLYEILDPKGKVIQINRGNIDQDNIAFLNDAIWHLWDRTHICNIHNCGVADHQTISKRSAGQLLSDMLFTDHHSKLWYVSLQETKSLVSVYDTRKKEWETKTYSIPSRINHIAFGQNNKPWLATQDGIYHLGSSGDFIPYKAGIQQISGKTLFLYPDQEGLIWIGFADKGLALHNPSANVFRLESSDANNKTIFTSLILSDGSVLIGGTFGAAIKKKNSNNWNMVCREKVSASTVDGRGNIWLGTPGKGIMVINKNKLEIQRFSKEKKQIPGNEVFHLQYDLRTKRVFASTKSGLSFFDEQTQQWAILNNAEDIDASLPLSGTYVLHTLTDRNGNLWVSTNGGVDVLDPALKLVKQFPSDTDTSIIKRTIITSVAEDPQGLKWISTLSNGLYRYDGKNFRHFGIKEGLGSNISYGSASDAKGRIWIATSAGINMLDTKSNRITSFGEDDGVAISDYTISSIRPTPDGLIHIGSTDGLIIIDPSKYKEGNRRLRVYLDQVMVNYEKVALDSFYQLSPSTKVVSFDFSAPSFINADKVVYQYRLKGFEDKWVAIPADNRRATFTNLPYRNLVLELRAAQHLSIIADAPITSIPIEVMPPFWRKPIFLIPFLLLIISSIVLIIRSYLRKKIEKGKRKAEIEQTIYKERERISRDLHDRLGAYAAAIKNNVVRMERSETVVADQLQQLKENAEEMVMALRETIWALQLPGVSMTSLSDRFKSLVNRIAPNYPDINIIFREEIIEDKELSPNEGIQLMRIMQESLTNALKHANAKEIMIRIASDKGIRVHIKDSGQGFDPDIKSDGQGLQNMRQRATEAGFSFEIQSGVSGTEISISMG